MPRGDGRAGRPTAPVKRPAYDPEQDFLRRHPGAVESLVPVWGSAREAIADAYDGDIYGVVGNVLLAGADLAPIGLAGKALKAAKFSREAVEASTRMNKARAYEWKKVRGRLGKAEYLERGQHGHHWAIPQNQWGKDVPDRIKNHPLNIKPMPDPETHWRIEHRVGDLPRFNPAMRYWHGTPAWGKAAHADAAGHVVSRTKHHYDQQTRGSKK